MKILNEIEFRRTLKPGDTVRLKHTRHFSDGRAETETETVLEHPITETMHCTHAAIIELNGELGYERAIGGVFGRKA